MWRKQTLPDSVGAALIVTYQNLGAVTAQVHPTNGFVVSSSAAFNDGKFHVFGMRRSGTTWLEVRVDGALQGMAMVPATNVDAAGGNVRFFAHGNNNAFTGAIAEVVAVRGIVSDVDLGLLEGYLNTKYGL